MVFNMILKLKNILDNILDTYITSCHYTRLNSFRFQVYK